MTKPDFVKARLGIVAILFLLFSLWALCSPVAQKVLEIQDSFVIAVFTILLVAVGAGQLGLFWWQLRLIRESLQDTKLAAEAANKSANAAIAVQRPWIKTELDIAGPLEIAGSDLRIEFRVKQKNIGNSPATNIQTWAYMICAGSLESLPLIKALAKQQRFDHKIGHSLFPNDDCVEPCWGGLTENELNIALAEAGIQRRISIVVVVSTRYKFIGGAGETKSVYTIHDDSFFETVDLRKLPIGSDVLVAKKETFLDVVD